jgi:hypothetical protein
VAISAVQRTMLITSVGETSSGVLAANVDGIWDSYTGAAGRLQYLYTKRDLIELSMGEMRTKADFRARDDVGVNATDFLGNLLLMKKDVDADILKEEAKAAAGNQVLPGGSVAAVGEILRKETSESLRVSGQQSANDMRYRGEPYSPRRTGWRP